MPRNVDYPRGSLKRALEIAESVQDLGGSCSMETCADRLGKRVTGSFRSQISAAVKFKLIHSKNGNLETTEHYRTIQHSYNNEEKLDLLKKSFLNIPIFNEVYLKFQDGKLPVDMLDKILIREFDVPSKVAGRVSNYLVASAKDVGLLNSDNSFNQINNHKENGGDSEPVIDSEFRKGDEEISLEKSIELDTPHQFIISVSGPGINFKKQIKNKGDFVLIEAILNNIKTQFTE